MMKSIASQRLQDALAFWQDTCWFLEATFRAASPDGKLPPADPGSQFIPPQLYNWRKLESLTFNNPVLALKLNDWDTSESVRGKCAEFDMTYKFPFEFFEWSRKSRRIFHLPVGLWNTLANATYPEIRWKDVLFPFDSFVITLEDALFDAQDEEGIEYRYDTILVARIPGMPGISLRILGGAADKAYPRISNNLKRRFEILSRRVGEQKKIEFLDQKLEDWRDSTFPPTTGSFVLFPDRAALDKRVCLETRDLLKELKSDRDQFAKGTYEGEIVLPAYSDAAKVVVGWCLYLRTLSPSAVMWKSSKRPHQKRGTKGVTGIITRPEHICSVLGEARLDPSSYGLSEPRSQNSGFFKRPHWRRAHYKRPQRSLPTAPKTVEVPPVLIRKDLVPYFGIIGGTKTEVLPED